jgi:hypothetical protein
MLSVLWSDSPLWRRHPQSTTWWIYRAAPWDVPWEPWPLAILKNSNLTNYNNLLKKQKWKYNDMWPKAALLYTKYNDMWPKAALLYTKSSVYHLMTQGPGRSKYNLCYKTFFFRRCAQAHVSLWIFFSYIRVFIWMKGVFNQMILIYYDD